MSARTLANILRYTLVVCAAAGGIYSLIRARAHWLFEQDTAMSVPAAVQLVPYDSAYLARLAAWRAPEKVALLKRAVALNPFDSESWIELGFVSEFQDHDNAAAERLYLRAAEVNKMFLPRWTLTNFYFRHGRTSEFFHWATLTLAITPYAPEPVFAQMWLTTQDPVKIAAAIPDRPRVLLPYAWFLSNNRQSEAIPRIVSRLVADAGKANPRAWGRDDLLAAILDRLLAGGDVAPALRVWSSLVRAHWLSETVPSIEAPVTNGSFDSPLYPHGFGWMPARIEGAYIDQMFSPGGLRLRLTGDQPENCLLVQQYLPLAPDRVYDFQWQAESSLAGSPSGLAWHLHSASDAAAQGAASPDIGEHPAGSWRVQLPSSGGLALLTLEYHRPLGQPRVRGALLLHSVSSKAVGSTLNH